MKTNLEQLASKLGKVTPPSDSFRIDVKKVIPDGKIMLVDRESEDIIFSFYPHCEWTSSIEATLDVIDNSAQILMDFIDWLGCDET